MTDMTIGRYAKVFTNSKTNQKTLTLSSRKLKQDKINVDDILNTIVNKGSRK